MSNYYLKPVAAILLPNLGGFAGRLVTRPQTKPSEPGLTTWYQTLKKPWWNPPRWVFPPVWTALNCSMGYASYLIYRDGGGFCERTALPLACYGTQLLVNWAWSPIFFKYKKLGLAFFVSCGLWGCIVASIVTFREVNNTASQLLMPYLAWVSYATCLQFNIWRNNRGIKAE